MIGLRIVAARLYRYMPNVTIEMSQNPFFDLVVTDKSDKSTFGVKVGSSSMFKNKSYDDYFRMVESSYSSKMSIPIIAAIPNKETENVKIGIITKLRLGGWNCSEIHQWLH